MKTVCFIISIINSISLMLFADLPLIE